MRSLRVALLVRSTSVGDASAILTLCHQPKDLTPN